MHTDYETIKDRLDANEDATGASTVWVVLADGDRAWNPVSESRDLYGPGAVKYRRFADGGIMAEEREL